MTFFVVAFILSGILLHQGQAAVYSAEQYRDFSWKCSKILATSAEAMKHIMSSKDPIVSDDREMQCFVRCMGIMTGFYGDGENDTNWDLVAKELEGKHGFEEHQKATIECIQALPHEELKSDLCRKAYLSFRCAAESTAKHIKDKH